jgi:hypothetical protein
MRVLLNAPDVLSHFLLLLALRRFCAVAKISYSDAAARWPTCFAKRLSFHWQVSRFDPTGVVVSQVVSEMSFWDLLCNMKINIEDLDWSTVRRAEIFAQMRRIRAAAAWQVSLAMWFFGSRAFLDALYAKALVRKLTAKSLDVVLRGIVHSVTPWRLFCRSFTVSKLVGNRVKRLPERRAAPTTMKLWRRFLRKHGYEQNKDLDSKNLSRRFVLSSLGRRMGAFSGKCFFQIWRASGVRRKCFVPTTSSPYTECGPGARSFLNVLQGLPRRFCVLKTGQDAADVYNQWLLQWMKQWRVAGARWQGDADLEFLADDLRSLTAPEFDEVRFQFVLCELSKAERYVDGSSVIYERSHHERERV